MGVRAGAAAARRMRSLGPDPLMGRLFPDSPVVVDWGLDRMRKALREVGDPHLRYRCLHVGGTNGKGSVASIWASALARPGRRVGLYTSPHLCSFRERIMIDGKPLESERLARTADWLRPLAAELKMSFFEATTLLAFTVFAEEEADFACVEVGLGGRLDATNVIVPAVTAITNVEFDHQDYLGGTLEEIAREKAGIMRQDVPVVTAADRPAALQVLQRCADEVGTDLCVVDPWRDIEELRFGPEGTSFTARTLRGDLIELRTPLPGAHQATNALVAVHALEILDQSTRAEMVAGVAQVSWPGRGQLHRVGDRLVYFDVAHNVAGTEALLRVLGDRMPPRPLVLLAGILGDKDWVRMLPPLVDLADHAVFTVPASAPPTRCWDPAAVAAQVAGDTPIEVCADMRDGLERASALARGGTVVVTGSCHTVGDALLLLGLAPVSR